MSAHLSVVPTPDSDADGTAPLVPEGVYRVVYVGHELVKLAMFGGALRLFIRFKITVTDTVTDPGHAGVTLWRACHVKPARRTFSAPKHGDLIRDLSTCTHLRLRPDRLYVRELLHGRVRTVTAGAKGRKLPPNCWYSVVAELLGAETDGPGAAPQLQRIQAP
jgi:hypothetical protein